MTRFIDSSALVKRYAHETGSGMVDRIVDSDETLWISDLSVVEVVSAIMKKVRKSDVALEDAKEAIRFLLRDVASGRFKTSVTGPADHKASIKLLIHCGKTRRLGSFDAIIIVSAMRIGTEVGGLEFLTADEGQEFAAREAGLDVKPVR